jgi:hypothetical protein
LEIAQRSVEIVEEAVPSNLLRDAIDEIYADIEKLFVGGEIHAADFREFRHRLWTARENVCDALLPETLRPKVNSCRLE